MIRYTGNGSGIITLNYEIAFGIANRYPCLISHLSLLLASHLHTIMPPHHRTIIPSYHRTIIPSYHRTIVPSYLCTSAPPHLRTVAPSYLRTSVPSYHRTIAPSYHRTSCLSLRNQVNKFVIYIIGRSSHFFWFQYSVSFQFLQIYSSSLPVGYSFVCNQSDFQVWNGKH